LTIIIRGFLKYSVVPGHAIELVYNVNMSHQMSYFSNQAEFKILESKTILHILIRYLNLKKSAVSVQWHTTLLLRQFKESSLAQLNYHS
jgi:hypothetical protein